MLIRLYIFLFCLAMGFSAHARSPSFVVRMAKMIGCGGLLKPTPLNADVQEFVDSHRETTLVIEDEEEPGTYHIKARIYSPKKFPNRKDLSPDAAYPFNFVVDDSEVRVSVMESKMSNEAFHTIIHHPDHFRFAQANGAIEFHFGVEYFRQFIAEVEQLGFAFY